MNYGVDEADLGEVALNYITGPITVPPLSNLLTRALGTPLDELVELTNDPRYLTGIVPAANTVTNANELSRFFEVMRQGGELDGVRVLETETIRNALVERSHLEIDISLGFPTRFSYGTDARRPAHQPLRPRHPARLRPPRLHQHARLGRSRAGDLGRGAQQRQADRLPRDAPLPGTMQRITSEMPKVPEDEWHL